MRYLADVNFLVALFHRRHASSFAATAWLREQTAGAAIRICICRVAQMGVFRLLTNDTAMKGDVLSAVSVWAAWDRLSGDPRFVSVPEPRGLAADWRRLTLEMGEIPDRPRGVGTDSYLAAFALAGDYSLLTFDRGFRTFPRLALTLLDSGPGGDEVHER